MWLVKNKAEKKGKCTKVKKKINKYLPPLLCNSRRRTAPYSDTLNTHSHPQCDRVWTVAQWTAAARRSRTADKEERCPASPLLEASTATSTCARPETAAFWLETPNDSSESDSYTAATQIKSVSPVTLPDMHRYFRPIQSISIINHKITVRIISVKEEKKFMQNFTQLVFRKFLRGLKHGIPVNAAHFLNCN